MAEEDLTKNASGQGGGQPAAAWQAPYPAAGWPGQSAPWGAAAPYPSTGWGHQSGWWPAAYPPPGPIPGVRWAGVGARLGALVIDFIILIAALFGLSMLAAAAGFTEDRDPEAMMAISIIWWLVVLMYHPACWYVFGASPGQKAVGLRLARASDGQALGLGGVLVRFLIFAFVTVLVPLGIVSAVMASQDPYKRAWHDMIARSVVVGRA